MSFRSSSHPPVLLLSAVVLSALALLYVFFSLSVKQSSVNPPAQSKLAQSIREDLFQPIIHPNATPTPTPKPTQKPYPPAGYHCVKVPILMYHHVEPLDKAKAEGHAQLTVDSGIFATQMQYLADKGYTTLYLRDLAEVFDNTTPLPAKPVILTFDDGYSDFQEFAVPIMASHGFKSDAFIPTGLIQNPGYMTWDQVAQANRAGASIDHHTWSHANVAQVNDEFFHREIDIATQQLTEHGYGPVRIFAYPYGTHNGRDVTELAKRGFSIAVTTEAGQIQCKEDRLLLHRTRIGNSSLKSYGL